MAETDESHIDRVWEVIAKAGICMMVTRFAGGLRALDTRAWRIARAPLARERRRVGLCARRPLPRHHDRSREPMRDRRFRAWRRVVLPARPRSLDPGARTGHLHLRAGVRQWLLL